ncbi:hypothetical protein DFS28_106237 [Pseudomonas sp. 478]|nr:hypothetical protein DFS28_106237 [Pseudomonas sp. 478]TCV40550.1 hypothetical protein EDB99_13021 [Pseudomonas sp. 460]
MRLSSGLVARWLLFKGLLCLWGQIVSLLFVSEHLWVMPGFGIWWGCVGVLVVPGVQPLLLAVALLVFSKC